MSKPLDPKSLRAQILFFLDQHSRSGSREYVTDVKLAQSLQQTISETRRQLDILEEQGLTTTANAQQGRRARISPAGSLEIEGLRPVGTASGLARRRFFISHAAEDRRIAERVDEEIRNRLPGNTTFIASRPGDIPAGEWFETVKKELRGADAYVAIITPRSKDRPWVLWEHGAAWMRAKKLISTRAGIRTKDIPEPLKLFQIYSLEEEESAAEVFKELGDTGEDLDAFCEKIKQETEAGLESTPARQVPPPIEVRWAGGTTKRWEKLTRHLEIHLRGDGPVEITNVEAWMTHRDDPETRYPGQNRGRVPATLGGDQSSLDYTFHFFTNDIPEELRGEQGNPRNLIILSAEVHYLDRDGHSGKRAVPELVVT